MKKNTYVRCIVDRLETSQCGAKRVDKVEKVGTVDLGIVGPRDLTKTKK
jgi:hypothetical protein